LSSFQAPSGLNSIETTWRTFQCVFRVWWAHSQYLLWNMQEMQIVADFAMVNSSLLFFWILWKPYPSNTGFCKKIEEMSWPFGNAGKLVSDDQQMQLISARNHLSISYSLIYTAVHNTPPW
jgi:hypothetical protein